VRYLRYYKEDMASQYWNETRAAAYRQFRYDFTETSPRGKTVIVSGGSGGLGAATVELLAREGADLVVGYRANRERAEALRQSIEANFESKISLVEGDIAATEVRRAYLAAAEKLESPLAGVAIFPGDPARVALENLNSDALLASLQSNYVGPILVAKEIGEVMEQVMEVSFCFPPCRRWLYFRRALTMRRPKPRWCMRPAFLRSNGTMCA
jgi:NAD(P)-dependent dehydrogenase (short-subunit alcohol dehydrogenase family)